MGGVSAKRGHGTAPVAEPAPADVQFDDALLWSKYGGTEVTYNGEEYLVLRASDLVGAAEGRRESGSTASGADEIAFDLRSAERLRSISARFRVSREATLDALEQLAQQTPAQSADPAASLSASDEAVLREAGSLTSKMPGLAERASTRTALAASAMLEDALTVKAAADRLGVSEGRIRQRITARGLLGIDFGGVWRLPAFQFSDDGQLRGFDRVLQAMPHDVHPIAVWRFIERTTGELTVDEEPVSPREWLATGGEIERVAELAESAYTLP